MKAPDPKHPLRHITPVQIRFNDIDMLGHLNNSIYMQFMDLAKAAYFAQFMEGGRFDWGEVTLVIANLRVPMHEIYARGLKNGNAEITLTISTQGLEHLQTIIQRLSKIRGVISVERSGK